MLRPLTRANTGIDIQRPVKVLQFGEGNFLRAFADWMIDILNEKTDFNGAIQIVQPLRQGLVDMLREQDGLYHVVLNGIRQGKSLQETRLITSVSSLINPYDAYDAYLQAAENPELRFIISNTTEAGIAFSATDTTVQQIAESFPGKLTALLYHRFVHFGGDIHRGLYLIPCELIDKNGDQLKKVIHQYIQHWQLPAAFAQWIDTANHFCNTLVDRIVPGYPKDTIQSIQQQIGYADKLVVMAEPFHLWVIEGPDHLQQVLPFGQTDLQVKFVKDMTPYRTRKVSILNGAHTAMVPVAYLRGLRTVQQAVEDPYTGKYIRQIIFDEIIPTLDLPPAELNQFAEDVIERFQNPFIRHELSSIALNAISKYKVRVLPTVLEYQKRTGHLPQGLVLALAQQLFFYKGQHQGEPLPVNDAPEVIDIFQRAWKQDDLSQTVRTILSDTVLWGTDLTAIKGLSEQLLRLLRQPEVVS